MKRAIWDGAARRLSRSAFSLTKSRLPAVTYASSPRRFSTQSTQNEGPKLDPTGSKTVTFLENLQNSSFVQQAYKVWQAQTGAKEIQALKSSVRNSSRDYDKAVEATKAARQEVAASLEKYTATQQEHLRLLQTKDSWSAADAASFTETIQKEMTQKQSLKQAQDALKQQEEALQQAQYTFMDRLRQRYQEEQAWQELWRIKSTYTTWGLVGLNSVIFITGQLFQQSRENRRMETLKEWITVHSKESTSLITNAVDEVRHEKVSAQVAVVQEVEKEPETTTTTKADMTKKTMAAAKDEPVKNESTIPSNPDGLQQSGRSGKACWASRYHNLKDKAANIQWKIPSLSIIIPATHQKASAEEDSDWVFVDSPQFTKAWWMHHYHNLKRNASSIQSNVKMEDVHFPSAVAGAAASALLYTLVLTLSTKS